MACLLFCGTASLAWGQSKLAVDDITTLKRLSIDELMAIEVSTVSRKEERWWSVPSGIDVVTGEDIRRAGVRNLPDALRLATGVHVGQPSARNWAVSIRGMNVLAANKISVVMDGRSLFTPFFSGVQWDAQDTLLEDIDRIEVVRGPVGALWGAFAVNGFIQILTKPAWDTQGVLASAGSGTEDPVFASVRYGGKAGENTFYRIYAKYSEMDWTYGANGQRAQPSTDFLQTGFRVDARRAQNTTLTLQGDYYTNQDLPRDRPQTEINGFNLLGRWKRVFSADSDLQVDSYFDRTYRLLPRQWQEQRHTGSASLKYRFRTGAHDLMIGGDAMLSADEIGNIGAAVMEPPERTTHTAGVYLLDTVSLRPDVALTAAIKGEHNEFSGFEYQPTARLAWTPNAQTTLWAAVSRAVRTPVRIDEDLAIRINGVTFFAANDDFKTETTLAYEVGFRRQPASSLTFDLSVFVYRYDDLRSTERIGAAAIPSTFRNMLNAKSHGGELTVMYQPSDRLFFKGSYRYLELEFSRDADSRDTSNGRSEGNDPKHVAMVGAHLDLPHGWELDAFVRHASDLPNRPLPGYTELDLRLGWRASNRWEISFSGRNLLDRQHPEFVTPNSLNEEVHRNLTAKATWRY